jgi:hypothetical protein
MYLRDEYAAVKLALAADPSMDIDTYIAGKSAVLQEVLAVADLTVEERLQILRLSVRLPDGYVCRCRVFTRPQRARLLVACSRT